MLWKQWNNALEGWCNISQEDGVKIYLDLFLVFQKRSLQDIPQGEVLILHFKRMIGQVSHSLPMTRLHRSVRHQF